MGIIDCASYASIERGYDYYKDKKVINVTKVTNTSYTAEVQGTTMYEIFIDVEHPRRSKCNCPHANGKRIICKHMIATYFTIFPNEADVYIDSVQRQEMEYEEYLRKTFIALDKYLSQCNKKQLKEHLFDLLESGPDWQFDNFVRDYVNMNDE